MLTTFQPLPGTRRLTVEEQIARIEALRRREKPVWCTNCKKREPEIGYKTCQYCLNRLKQKRDSEKGIQ